MMQRWKVPHILKGMLTWLPVLNAWRQRHATTGGTNSPRYCYSVWLRHLVTLNDFGFRIKNARVGELGPGDSIGVGLAALLSGAKRYVGLDVVPFSAKADLKQIFEELAQMYFYKEEIPDHNEFPYVRPILDSYKFPNQIIDWTDFNTRVETLRLELRAGVNGSQSLAYHAPWISSENIPAESLDLMFSQSVLQYLDAIEETYRAMAKWLRPGGYASHVINFSGHYLSPVWNGHWAYSDWEWKLTRGRREFFLNREPISTHLSCSQKVGFKILVVKKEYERAGMTVQHLSPKFRMLDAEDLQTRGALIVLQKRADGKNV